ncbi:MAG TPA: D-glycerate dehydrogenase [Candidatus Nitrosopolaris sp.]|nr:D-glycerate dehydrogenase [Candidatus Nitrosopolaris sp.]
MEPKKCSVYVTRKILDPAIPMISKECRVIVANHRGRPPPRNELLGAVRDKDAILCTLSDIIDAKVMDAAGPNLKVISSYSTGTDHIDIKEATKRGIYVTFTGDILTEATADLAFALILATSRHITRGHELVTRKRWKYGWDPHSLLGSDVHGMTIGIVGLGRIGSAVARRAKGFDMDIIYHNRHRRNILMEEKFGARHVDMDQLMEKSDFLSLHCSLDSESYHLINESNLRRMKNDSYIINTARGQIINEAHLIKALKQRWIAGAGLDVFEKEPPSLNNPLLKMKNVVLLPHIGSATLLTRTKMAEVAAKNLLNVLNRKTPLYLANPEVTL